MSEWLFTRFEATKAQIAAGDVLIVRVETDETAARQAAARLNPLKVDTGSNTLLEERAYTAIRVRLPNDPRRRTYMLLLAVCAEVQYGRPSSDPNYLGAPGNPSMAVLPYFYEYTEHPQHLDNEMGYIFGKPTKYGVPDPIPIFPIPLHDRQMISHNYQEGRMAITRFNAADWPAAKVDIENMTKEVLSRMMQYIGEQG